jgi:hypothetical protein
MFVRPTDCGIPVRVCVDDEREDEQRHFEDDCEAPCCNVSDGGRGFGVDQRNQEETVDEEGADDVNLGKGVSSAR